MKEFIKSPFPYFGGKSKAKDLIWAYFGAKDCGNYCEPFFGSGAVYINRPEEFKGWAVINDLDGNVANFWRAMQKAPNEIIEHCIYPSNECDLHAIHLHLVNNLPKMGERLMADIDFYDAKIAGFWVYGVCNWIGGSFCGGGPWTAQEDEDGILTLKKGNGGRGINRKKEYTLEWFTQIQESLFDARVACGDWQRICSVGTITRNGICAVLLDPPYSQTDAVYSHDSKSVANDVRKWCVENGNNPKLRIALCGHDGEHNELESLGWTVETWDKSGGYQGSDDRERIWFSPHCVKQNNLKQQIELF